MDNLYYTFLANVKTGGKINVKVEFISVVMII